MAENHIKTRREVNKKIRNTHQVCKYNNSTMPRRRENVRGLGDQLEDESWMLVKFKDDGITFVTKKNDSDILPGSQRLVKWKDGRKYLADILAVGCKTKLITTEKEVQSVPSSGDTNRQELLLNFEEGQESTTIHTNEENVDLPYGKVQQSEGYTSSGNERNEEKLGCAVEPPNGKISLNESTNYCKDETELSVIQSPISDIQQKEILCSAESDYLVSSKEYGSRKEVGLLCNSESNGEKEVDLLCHSEDNGEKVDLLCNGEDNGEKEVGLLCNSEDNGEKEVDLLCNSEGNGEKEVDLLCNSEDNGEKEVGLLCNSEGNGEKEVGLLCNSIFSSKSNDLQGKPYRPTCLVPYSDSDDTTSESPFTYCNENKIMCNTSQNMLPVSKSNPIFQYEGVPESLSMFDMNHKEDRPTVVFSDNESIDESGNDPNCVSLDSDLAPSKSRFVYCNENIITCNTSQNILSVSRPSIQYKGVPESLTMMDMNCNEETVVFSDNESIDDSVNDPDYTPSDLEATEGLEDLKFGLENNASSSDFFESGSETGSKFDKECEREREMLEDCTNTQYIKNYSSSDLESEIIPIKTSFQGNMVNENYQNKVEEGITVCVSKDSSTVCKRVWNRKAVCVYCSKVISKLSKHLFARHRNEKDVLFLCTLPKGSRERKNLLKKLRNAGNFEHNKNVIMAKKGSIIPSKRPPTNTSFEKYSPCESCLGYYLKRDLWRHAKICTEKKTQAKGRVRHQNISLLLMPVPDSVSKELVTNVLSKMQSDEVTLVVRNDNLILQFGSKLYQKHGHEPHLYNYISQKLRELGRFVLCISKIDKSVRGLADCIVPDKFETVIAAIRKLCGYQDDTHQYNSPSLVLKLGHSLKKCATLLKGSSIVKRDEQLQKAVDDFKSLFEMEWTNQVSSNALMTISKKKWNKLHVLPLAEDIKKLQVCLNQDFEKWKTYLEKTPNKESWDGLCRATLAKVILFNRKRSGEAQRLEVHTFVSRDMQPCHSEVMQSLSKFEKLMINSYSLLETRGKRGKKVPVLLSKDMVDAINLLVEHRSSIGIPKDNVFIFARSNYGSLSCLRGSDVLHQYAITSGAQHPETVTSTKLRKHIATMSQVFNLSKSDMKLLATFMGHDLDVHKDFYRLPESTLLLAKVSKVLVAAEKGDIHKFKGKSLDEIDLDVVESDTNTSGNDETVEIHADVQITDNGKGYSKKIARNKHTKQKSALTVKKSEQSIDSSDSDAESRPPQKKRKGVINRQPWSIQEKQIVEHYLSKCFLLQKLPGKTECLNCINDSGGILTKRKWQQVKYYVYNNLNRK